ncbi:XRE family transcriptional regulator [Albidovulum sp.]|uniref:XRE family transcriptional regulator n=1 Tax=Albidovulum sp. TaxID=1872424 RepID=UPI0039B8D762
MRLKDERLRLEMNQEAFAAMAGQSKKSQMRYEAEERSPDTDYLSALAKHGVDVVYVLTGQRSPLHQQMRAVRATYGPILDQARRVEAQTQAALDAIVDGDFIAVPVHQAALGAGSGVENRSEDLIGHLAFRRSWLRCIGVSAASAVLARADGESMAPTIHHGDLLLIDCDRSAVPPAPRATSDTRPAPIYAILDEGAARVKRVELVPGGTLALLSDNPAFAPEFRPVPSVAIIGKVMWWGHTNRD